MMFRDRTQAGQLLAKKLAKYKGKNAIVLALPRGGVPLGAEVADFLQLPLEVLVVRKVGAPSNSELAVGAICENEEPVFNNQILSRIGLESDDMQPIVDSEIAEIQRQVQEFRHGETLSEIEKKISIIIDDGLATGATALAAVNYLRKKGAAQVIVAVPIAAASSARSLRSKVEELVTIEEAKDLTSIGEWYQDFSQVSDQEVLFFLKSNAQLKSRFDAVVVGPQHS